MSKMIDPETLPYRPCVGLMILNKAGLVWVGHRIAEPDSEFAGTTQLWQMPQGGIDKGEEPIEAAGRELYEETGMRSVSLLAEAPRWINYDLPPHLVGVALGGRYRGQKQRWFALRFTGEDSDIRLDADPDPEFDAWRWAALNELPALAVDFKRPIYRILAASFVRFAAP